MSSMKLKTTGGFEIRNIVSVYIVGDGKVVGEMHIERTSGWRGGPSYRFYPNATGQVLGLKDKAGKSLRQLLKDIVP
jgi:hypothetical protein